MLAPPIHFAAIKNMKLKVLRAKTSHKVDFLVLSGTERVTLLWLGAEKQYHTSSLIEDGHVAQK